MRILITGANGTVGNAILSELGDRDEYEFTCLDIEDHPDRDTVIADITDYDDIRPHFEDQDAVIHLAAAAELSVPWDTVNDLNINGTYNVLQAAADAEVEDFIFASSIHTVGMYEIDHAPELYDPEFDLSVTHRDPPRPDSFYGVSKVFGEAMGRQFVESKPNPLGEIHPVYEINRRDYPTSFYSVRILTVLEEQYDHPYGLAETGVDEGWWERDSDSYDLMAKRMKCTWFSHRDLGQLVSRCLEDDSVDFDIFWGVSGNESTWVNLDHTQDLLGYEPKDDGSVWDSPPS
ncbi:NAD-dependent epimerase/dehydratase family protein [Halobacterium sp. KA-6]|uniref:NAD-dependent epimerase/dehydratase family protein n=1 Tax=Halobacterium sp. KA-6 TaxID=2896368 RepID=UPI001E31E0D5|nr:NAD(P)-dependent oxidoreductase [Halobacterium sp. KA-6]MCD2205215.1 NAD(P)-dependent oxidoreductase [Halobacterium sp. KA-6]